MFAILMSDFIFHPLLALGLAAVLWKLQQLINLNKRILHPSGR